jgi:hypothetical protein
MIMFLAVHESVSNSPTLSSNNRQGESTDLWDIDRYKLACPNKQSDIVLDGRDFNSSWTPTHITITIRTAPPPPDRSPCSCNKLTVRDEIVKSKFCEGRQCIIFAY